MEGFGLMPLEALACGTPVVATNYGGPRQYLDQWPCGSVEPAGIVKADLDVPGVFCDYAEIDVPAVAERMAMMLWACQMAFGDGDGRWRWNASWLGASQLPLRENAPQLPHWRVILHRPPDDGSWAIPELEDILPPGPGTASWDSEDTTLYGFSPSGLGSLDLALEAIAEGGNIGYADGIASDGLPPWWRDAASQSDAEERLQSHLDQLNFWWADLLEHIRATGWWPKCVQ
jgi:hypothetical protein